MWIKESKNNGDEKKRNPNSFFERTYKIVRQIPYGKVTTYNAIAKYLDVSGNSANMVGLALDEIGEDFLIPAHRVVHRDGGIAGNYFSGSTEQKRKLLENDGFIIENDKVQNFNKAFWDPAKRV